MMTNTELLINIAFSVVDDPWGVGEPILQCSESAPGYYRFLHKLVKLYKPELVVECGTYLGFGAAHMAIGNRNTQVYTIDVAPHPSVYSITTLYKNIHLLIGKTTDPKIYTELAATDKKIGLLFLDSEHDGFTATYEYEMYSHLFADECVVACDDILDPRMKTFWKQLPGEKMEMNFLHVPQFAGQQNPGFGISIVRKDERSKN